jgi:hypothetical protein
MYAYVSNFSHTLLSFCSPDHWLHWQQYIASCLKLETAGWTPPENDDRYAFCLDT